MDMHIVVMDGFPTSIIAMAHVKGRCWIGRTNSGGNITDHFHLLLRYTDFVYFNLRLYRPPDKETTNNNPTIYRAEEISIQRASMLRLLKIIVLKDNYWHIQLDNILADLHMPQHIHLVCGNTYPSCVCDIDKFIMPICSTGILLFLADTFISNASGSLTMEVLTSRNYLSIQMRVK